MRFLKSMVDPLIDIKEKSDHPVLAKVPNNFNRCSILSSEKPDVLFP